MNLFDAVVIGLLVLAAVTGARAGFMAPVLGLAGAVGGFVVALLLASVLREPLTEVEQPGRALLTLGGVLALVFAGEAIGTAAGAQLSRGIRYSPFRPLDAVGGAIVGMAHVVFFVWIVGGLLAMGLAPSMAAMAQDSVAIQITEERLPAPITVAGRVMTLLDTTDLPPLFGGLEGIPSEPVDLPDDATSRALAESAIDSTAQITAGGCGFGLSTGSGFFIAPAYAVTNAHVVAGSTSTTVTVGGGSFDADVVVFDPDADLALLHVPGAAVEPLALLVEAPLRGTTGVALGFPGGNGMTVTAAGITNTVEVGGPNIYGQTAQQPRTVVELQAAIRKGNSGGPLIVEPGTVGAVIFGASRLNPEVGYAIGVDEVVDRLRPSVGSTAPTDTGACL
jgi:S1-C subfamily serine protease